MIMTTSTEKHIYRNGERTAKVFEAYEGYYVEFYIKDKCVERRNLWEFNEAYAESAAENWCLEVIQLNEDQ